MDQQGEVLPDLLPRITAAAAAAVDAEDAWRLRVSHRDQLVTKAVDAGVSQRSIAAAAGLSKARIVGIMAGSQDPSITV
jgi:hypothetical protein